MTDIITTKYIENYENDKYDIHTQSAINIPVATIAYESIHNTSTFVDISLDETEEFSSNDIIVYRKCNNNFCENLFKSTGACICFAGCCVCVVVLFFPGTHLKRM